MSKEGLEALKRIKSRYNDRVCIDILEDFDLVEKELKALKIIVSIFDIKIVGDYLIAQRGDTCVVENLKLRQTQEIINLLKGVLL